MSANIKFVLKDSDIEKVQEAIVKYGENSESVLNNFLHTKASDQLVRSITNYIPVSKNGDYHAKSHKWYEVANYNLTIEISNSLAGKRGTSFYYLYYVLTGTGTSKKKGETDFFQLGIDAQYDNIVNEMLDLLTNNFRM